MATDRRAELITLRRRLRERTEEYRASFLSRAGRLCAAQDNSRILGEMLRDEVSEHPFDNADVFASVEALKPRTLLDQVASEFVFPPSPDWAAELIPGRLKGDSRERFPNRAASDSPWQTEEVCHGGRDRVAWRL